MDGFFLSGNNTAPTGAFSFCRFIFFVFLLCLLPATLNATELKADYFTYKSGLPEKTHLEIYFSISNQHLHFLAREAGYQADVIASVIIKDPFDQVIDKYFLKETVIADHFESTIDRYTENIFQFNFQLSPGQYEALLLLEDVQSGKRYKKDLEVMAADYQGESVTMSSLLLSEIPQKSGAVSLPKIDNTYSFTHPSIKIYFETYQLNFLKEKETITTQVKIQDVNGQIAHVQNHKTRVSNRQAGFEVFTSLRNLASGEYTLVVSQFDSLQQHQAQARKKFRFVQSPIDLRFKDFGAALDELKYIASRDEIIQLRAAAKEQRQDRLNEFWSKRDPLPHTPINELMMEYYNRLERCNQLFTKNGRPGWKTDFGLVYVLFGKPDGVRRESGMFGFEERQVWVYGRLGMSFTFIYGEQFGDYSLLEKPYIFANYMAE